MAEEEDNVAAAPAVPAIVRDYAEGRASVEDFLNVCRSYQGPAPHFLLSSSADDNDEDEEVQHGPRVGCVFLECLRVVPEDGVVALVEAAAAETPQIFTFRESYGEYGDTLLHIALQSVSSRLIHLLLAVPGTARLSNNSGETPLHVACHNLGRVHPDVIHRLIDLDPDVLTLGDCHGQVPLHGVLAKYPTSPHVTTMIELRPESLLVHRSVSYLTPIAMAMLFRTHDQAGIDALGRLSQQHPGSFALPGTMFDETPLMLACTRHHPHYRVWVRTIADAYPPSLLIPHLGWARYSPRVIFLFPFEEVQEQGGYDDLAASLRKETVRMAFAVTEYVLGVDAATLARTANSQMEAECAANVAWFQQLVKDAIQEHVVPTILVEERNNTSDEAMMAFIRALFCHGRVCELLCDDARLLRDLVLCETVIDLYRLNCRGRYHPNVSEEPQVSVANDADSSGATTTAAALHQIDLFASLRDSSSVESTYLQFRQLSHHVLWSSSSNGRGGGVGEPTIGSSTEAGGFAIVVNSPKNRKRPAPDSEPTT